MVVGVSRWELHLEGCHSLKEKRSRLKPLQSRLRRELNLSVAETGLQDVWQRAELACAGLGSDRAVVDQLLRSADRLVGTADGVRIIETVVSYA